VGSYGGEHRLFGRFSMGEEEITSLTSGERIIVGTFLSRRPHPRARWVTLSSVILLVVSSSAYWDNWGDLQSALPAIPEAVFRHHEFWRLITGQLIHSDWNHLADNLFPFILLSYLLYGYFGAAIFPLASLVMGMLTFMAALWTYPPEVQLVGASGMIYAMAAFWLALYLFVDRRYWFPRRLLHSAGFALVFLFPSTLQPNVSYRTHAIGFGVGLLCGATYYALYRRWLRTFEVTHVEEPLTFSD
jgi:rhomboid protease GluP